MLFKKISSIKSHFQEKVILYGYSAAILIAIKGILYRCFGFRWEKCYLMSCLLDEVCALPARKDIEIRELVLSDYDNELWSSFLTKEKRAIYETRFLDEKTIGYGVFVEEKLAYSIWILYGEVVYSETEILLKSDDCALLLDGYCHPLFRGCGIHNYMNQWCLFKIKECGVKKAYGIVLSSNRPGIKTQKKCGLEVERVFYSWKFGKHKYVTFKYRNNG